MSSTKRPGIIPIFVPHMGCPYDCVFCNQKKITGQKSEVDYGQVVSIIDSHLKTMRERRYPIEIAFFGGSFTGIHVEIQNEYLSIARRYLEDGHIHGIRLSTRPDYINEEIVHRLSGFGVTTIELGVQSLDQEVLLASHRGHDEASVEKAVKTIRAFNISLGLQMMIGLPEDTLEKAKMTSKKIINLQPDFVRIYPTVVIKDTELERLYNEKKYSALTVEGALEWLSEIMPLYSQANIPIIRVGLQPTDDLTEGKSQVAGAYHPSLRQLAVSRIILKKILKTLEKIFLPLEPNGVSESEPGVVILTAHRKDWTPVRGDKAYNFNQLALEYPQLKFDYVISDTIERGEVHLKINEQIESIILI